MHKALSDFFIKKKQADLSAWSLP